MESTGKKSKRKKERERETKKPFKMADNT
uniref:Uncharacterized protein n=1 Tax=Tetranychus urticae TaxID=32264 RepID=T1K3E3_TETUR